MKGLAVLFGLAVVGLAGFIIFQGNMNSDDQRMITIAIGNPHNNECDIHLVVAHLMVLDGPRKDANSNAIFWDEWLEQHFILTSADGKKVRLERLANSNLIDSMKAGGSPEFFIKGKVVPGTAYTFDYVPDDEGPDRFRYEFTAPAEMPLTRVNFVRVNE
jgi:hypothetical protein